MIITYKFPSEDSIKDKLDAISRLEATQIAKVFANQTFNQKDTQTTLERALGPTQSPEQVRTITATLISTAEEIQGVAEVASNSLFVNPSMPPVGGVNHSSNPDESDEPQNVLPAGGFMPGVGPVGGAQFNNLTFPQGE